MSEKRFKKRDTIIDPFPIWDTVEEKGYNCTDTLDLLVDLLNELYGEMKRFGEHNYKLEQYNLHYLNENTRLKEENEQLKQILKDIVEVTDETYTKNTSMFKVTVVLNYEKYREIRRCIE